LTNSSFLQVIEKAVEVGADSSQYPNSWIFHSREKKPDKAFVDGLLPHFVIKETFSWCYMNGGRSSQDFLLLCFNCMCKRFLVAYISYFLT